MLDSFGSHISGQTESGIRILYYDDNLVIVDKPVNAIVHGRMENVLVLQDTLRIQMEKAGQSISFLAPSNRLDRNTSGPVVFSRNSETANLMRRLFTRCEVDKVYHARLIGALDGPVFVQADVIKGHHRRASVENLQIVRDNFPDKGGWFAERTGNSSTISGTVIEPLAASADSTLVAIHPWTGRFHQIRVICQAIGFPIQGDKKYNRTPYSGSCRESVNRREWTVPALICKSMTILSLNISVESSFTLE